VKENMNIKEEYNEIFLYASIDINNISVLVAGLNIRVMRVTKTISKGE
jgi:hypothetical protein